VDGLDLTQLIASYESGGTTPYHPRMLLKVVFHAYMNNTYSCRRIASAMERDIHYMWLSGSQYPSFSTINRFRSEHIKDCVNQLFVQAVEVLVEMGQVRPDVQYIDGTRIESVASKYTFVWRKSTETNKGKLEEKIRSVLSQIDEGIARDHASESDMGTSPIDSASLEKMIDKINECTRQQEARTKEEKQAVKQREKQVKELRKHQQKPQEYENKPDIMGDRNSYSKTDLDATFMRMKEDAMNKGQTKPGYNLQTGTENQYITNFGLYPDPGDTLTLAPFLYLLRFDKLPKELCADAGYGSEENYFLMEESGIEAYVKYNYFHKEQKRSFKNDPFRQENLYYNPQGDCLVCPMGQRMHLIGEKTAPRVCGMESIISRYQAINCDGCPLKGLCTKAKGYRIIEVNHRLVQYKQKARERLLSEQGVIHRKKRPIEPEAVFGQMKFNMAYKRFRHKGFEKVQMDFGVFAMAFNLKKLCKNLSKEAFAALFGKIRLYVRMLFSLKSQLYFPQSKVSRKWYFKRKNAA
jgi:transposase